LTASVAQLRAFDAFIREQHGIRRQEVLMTYRAYSGPRGSESISPQEKDRHLYKEFSLLDEAISWARHVNESGRVTLLIEGDDGTRLTKQEIATALKHPGAHERRDEVA
jgi:hypothetical protein